MISQNTDADYRRVALLILNASDWSRQVHDGIAAFARTRRCWDFWLQPRGMKERASIPTDWNGDGIICRLADEQLKLELQSLRLPTVNISWHGEHSPEFPKVISDLEGCGRLCAEYFLERGFHTFAYFGPQSYYGYQDQARITIRDTLIAKGYSLSAFTPDATISSPDLAVHRNVIGDWIESLPKPVAVICWSTIVAREVIIASLNQKLQVPNDVAVLAIEHDPLLSALSPIPISHVMQRPQVVGYTAAETLESMMSGQPAPAEPIMIAPEGIMECLSTDTRFGSDDLVNQAITHIRKNLHRNLNVSDLTVFLNVSRRTLEDRFRRALNKTPADEIRLARLNRLKELLRDPELTLSAITFMAGFSYQEVMIRFFKRETGQTPGDYRRNVMKQSYQISTNQQK